MKLLFLLAHQINDFRFYSTYNWLMKNQWRPYHELKDEMENALRKMIAYSYRNTPYYHALFRSMKLKPEDIKSMKDLERLPILTKEIIKKNWDNFIPKCINKIRYYDRSTGGSTGTPFRFRLDRYDRMLGVAIRYRGWGYAGYRIGDRVVILGGSSLGVNKKFNLERKVDEIVRNRRYLSSYDLDEKNMKRYLRIINQFKPKYMYGYACSFYFFARWLEQNRLEVHSPEGIFSTAEKIFPEMRKKVEEVFRTEVYDNYGLNDGGVSAAECSEHSGLHIDTERGVMEVVDNEGKQIENGKGRILATSLFNYAMPFIRYDTGDMGNLIPDRCGCGRGYRLLKEIIGRQQEILLTPEGKYIHGGFFPQIFWEIDGIKEFQVIQSNLNRLTIRIVPEVNFNKKNLEFITQIIRKRSTKWQVEFEFVDEIETTDAGKYKFVINRLKE